MSDTSRFDSLAAFATFVQQLVEDGVDCTPAEAVERWNAFKPELEDIQRAILQIDEGKCISGEEMMRQLDARLAELNSATPEATPAEPVS